MLKLDRIRHRRIHRAVQDEMWAYQIACKPLSPKSVDLSFHATMRIFLFASDASRSGDFSTYHINMLKTQDASLDLAAVSRSGPT